jgi:hypothetical protein
LLLDPEVKIGKLPDGLRYYIKKNTKPEKKFNRDCWSMQDLYWRTQISKGWLI